MRRHFRRRSKDENTGRSGICLPPITLLSAEKAGGRVDGREEVRMNKERLEAALMSFGINSPISSITRAGPSVTRYETELEAGVKLNKLTNLAGRYSALARRLRGAHRCNTEQNIDSRYGGAQQNL